LNELSLQEVRQAVIGRLSKGYKQRVGLAGALVHDPQVLILDEPTVGLDPKQIVEMRRLLQSLGGKKTLVFSSHILAEVQQVCHRIVIINKGRLVTINTQEELIHRSGGAHRLVVRLGGMDGEHQAVGEGHAGAGDQHVVEKLKSLRGVKAVLDSRVEGRALWVTLDCDPAWPVQEAVGDLALRERWPVYELRPLEISLEEVFLQLTGDQVTSA